MTMIMESDKAEDIPAAHRVKVGEKFVRSLKRLKPTEPSEKLLARQKAHTEGVKTVDAKYRNGHHMPGSQNRNKK